MITPTYDLDDDQWNMLVQDAADHFDDVTLNRGFQYYKQGKVLKMTIPSHRYVKAIVEGSERYDVEVNLDFFTLSHCSCPVSGNCKHMFAVMLKYADLHNRSVHMLVNAKTTALSKPSVKPAPHATSYRNAKQIAAKKAESEAAELKAQAGRIPTMSIPEWHELYELCTARLLQSSRNAQFVQDSLEAIFRIKPQLIPEKERLFTLHAYLFVLSKLTKQPQDQSSGYLYSYLAYHAHHAASDLQNTIEQCIVDSADLAGEPDNEHLVEQTLTYLRKEMLTEANENHYFLYHYLSIWSRWIYPHTNHNARPYSEELQQLEATAGDLDSSLFARRIAQAGMHLYLSNDPEAWKLLVSAKQISDIPSDYLLYFLDYLSKAEQWPRLTSWLIETAPLLSMKRNNKIRSYSDFWELAVHHLPDAEQRMWDTLATMLPHSRALYEEKLLAHEKWERWMDYHLSIDSDPHDFRVTDLRPLEKNAPEVLLPFYHQAVERYVLIKNRDGYKAAVKLLKRLAKLYKKMKQEPRWELFLTTFASRNSRLRALQEELRKGKLLQ